MAEISWIKIKTGMFDDEKIKLIQSMPEGDALIVIWIRLLCLAGKSNQNGFIQLNENIGYNEEMLSTIFNKDMKIIRLALVTLQSFSMIEIFNNNVIHVENWEKHQNVDGMDKVRQLNSERQKRFREKNKELNNIELNKEIGQKNITLCNVTVTEQIRSDKDKDKDNNIESGEIKISHEKTKENYKLELEKRKLEFKKEIWLIIKNSQNGFKEFFCNDENKELKKFFEYWSEHKENGKKMRKEFEKVFDIKRRLNTWKEKSETSSKFSKKQDDGQDVFNAIKNLK